MRRVSLWDLRDTSKCIGEKLLQVSNSHLLAFYDADTALLYVTAIVSFCFYFGLGKNTNTHTHR